MKYFENNITHYIYDMNFLFIYALYVRFFILTVGIHKLDIGAISIRSLKHISLAHCLLCTKFPMQALISKANLYTNVFLLFKHRMCRVNEYSFERCMHFKKRKKKKHE